MHSFLRLPGGIYPPHFVFGTGTGDLAQTLIHNNLFGVTKCSPFGDKIPLFMHYIREGG